MIWRGLSSQSQAIIWKGFSGVNMFSMFACDGQQEQINKIVQQVQRNADSVEKVKHNADCVDQAISKLAQQLQEAGATQETAKQQVKAMAKKDPDWDLFKQGKFSDLFDSKKLVCSSEAVDFIFKLMRMVPSYRMSMEEARNHEWLSPTAGAAAEACSNLPTPQRRRPRNAAGGWGCR
eukprot:TRINITY_DN19524_c0_g2_i2.p1 TRINITY_DN19524_c0_g2~~TRINITY_DN19524_c0_g2_i2.p1  ORF type:complete len:178 (+),score=46.07 TRINITY_DN19524_c0_g2_i2:2-535(+)